VAFVSGIAQLYLTGDPGARAWNSKGKNRSFSFLLSPLLLILIRRAPTAAALRAMASPP
jgi:hypothetical protein